MEEQILKTVLEPAVLHKHGVVVEVDDPDAGKRRIYVAIRKIRESGDSRFNKLKIRILNGNRLLVFIPLEDQ